MQPIKAYTIKVISIFISAVFLCQNVSAVSYLAPESVLPRKEDPNSTNKYQSILKRFIESDPACVNIPSEKFEEFVKSAETLFSEYRSFSRFAFNPQAGVQFVENKRSLIHEIKRLFIEALGHIKKKDSCNRREGLRRLTELVKSKLGESDYAVIDLMGRPGVGKSTIAGKIKNGFADLKADEILVISVDGFRNNDVSLVNELIARRSVLNTPLSELGDDDFDFFVRVSKSLQFPLVRDSDKSFLDFYAVSEEREQVTGENKRDYRRRKLWSHIGSNPRLQRNLDVSFRLMLPEDYDEIIRIAREMRLDISRMTRDSEKSFSDIYAETDNEEFLLDVKSREKISRNIKLFVVEGTYSYQGEKIFDPTAERLMEKDPDRLVKVMIELDEDIRQQRIRDRHRSDMEEMLILGSIFDGIFTGSIDLERNSSDIVIDNTESTDIFQIKQTHSGVKAQFGMISETARTTFARQIFEKEVPPDLYVLPPELFRGGRSYADIEFLMYYSYFIQGGKRVSIAGTKEQIERMRIFLKESLFGPDEINGVSEETRNFIRDAAKYFAVKDEQSQILSLDGFINFHVLEIGAKINLEVKKGEKQINVELEHIRAGLFSLKEEGYEPDLVEVDYREPSESDYPLTVSQQIAIQNARNNTMAVTPMGSEDGFTPIGDYTNFIMWFEGIGIHVDPSPRSLIYLEKAGIDPDDIPYILLTHNHADHDSGLIRKILMKKRVKLLATRPVYESFLVKARALMGEGFAVETWLDWVELKDEETNEIALSRGEKVKIDIRYNMHPIPTIGFIASYKDKSFGYSGDTRYEPALINGWLAKGRITKEQADKLLYFFWDEQGRPKVDLLFHESGDRSIHTLIEDLCDLPEAMYERTYIVHASPATVKDIKRVPVPLTEEMTRHFGLLRQPGLFDTKVLIPMDTEAERAMLVKTLDNVNLLSHLSQDAKRVLLNKSVVRNFNPGDPVIFEGAVGDTFYIILSGHAEVVKGGEKVVDASGKEWLLGGDSKWTYYPKDSFGEVALTDDKPRTASVRAVSSLNVLEIRKEDFLNMIYGPLQKDGSDSLRAIKYCIEEWIQKYSESLIYNISDINLTQIAKQVALKNYAKGEKIITQGENADTAYIIFKGKVGVYRDGNKVADLSSSDIFGEMALLESIRKGTADVKRNADCITDDSVQVLEISKDLLKYILHLYPGLDRGLSYEFRKRQLPQAIRHPSPHKYMVKRSEKHRDTVPREETERVLDRRHIRLEDLDKLADEEKVVAFLNNIFSDFKFLAPDEFFDEFYNPPVYRENLIRLNQHLKSVFPSYEVQRFYHKFIEVSIYDKETQTKTIYRFARSRKKNIYRWMKESEVDVITKLPAAPINSFLINLESEKYQGVKGTPENVKTLQAYIEMYNPECNLSMIDCQWPENNIDFLIERIKIERPEMICLSSTFGCLRELEKLMKAIRKMPFKPLVVIGGLTSTWSYDYLLEKYPEVICVQREGEEALSSLAKLVYENGIRDGELKKINLLGSIPNLIYIECGKINKNYTRKVDLKRAPHPSRGTQLTRMKNAGFLFNAEGFGRGCGYGGCTFCTRTHGRLRRLSLTRVTGDFEEYMRGGASFIVYADEDFLPDDPKDIGEFISNIEAAKEKYRNEYFLENGSEPNDLSFYIATRARCIWREDDPVGNEERVRMLERLKKAGLVKIFLGVESGSPVQLKKTYNKEANLTEMKKAIEVVRGLGIQLVTGFIMFDPVVTLGQLQDNIQFVKEMNLVKADPLTEPINPFKQYRAQIGSALLRRYQAIGLISSDHDPDTLMHESVYRSKPINLIMNMGQNWDDMISKLEYSLKGIVWHAEQSPGEMDRAELFVNLFNWFRERGYSLLGDLTNVLLQDKEGLDLRIDRFFDKLKGLGHRDKLLFEVKRAIFPHSDVYEAIERYVIDRNFNEKQILHFLKRLFKGEYPSDWKFEGNTSIVFDSWIKDIARDISFQIMSKEEIDAIKGKLNEIYKKALIERLVKLKAFKDSNWRSYYSLSPDLVERGIEFNKLLEDNINEHSATIAKLAEPKGMVSHEEAPHFKIHHRVSLKDYFQYRHPDLAEPLGVLTKVADLFESEKKSASLDKIFLYADGTLRCDELQNSKVKQMMDIIYQGLKQIYFSSYDPFNLDTGKDPIDFVSVLYSGAKPIRFAVLSKNILRDLYKTYAAYYKKDFEYESSISFTNKTLESRYYMEIVLPSGEILKSSSYIEESENMPAGFRWEIPESIYKPDDTGKPIITRQFSEHAVNIIKNLLREEINDEEYRRNIMIVNAIITTMLKFNEERGVDWISSVCDIIDNTVRPLTVYLPDDYEGREIVKSADAIPVIFINRYFYHKVWPGIMPHIEDIMLLATPGILDDFPAMLQRIKKGELRPDLVQLIYEVFHNRVPLDVYRRNSNVKEIINYTSSAMRVMPRKTPVLVLDPSDPRVGKYVSDRPDKYMVTQDGKLRFLLSPYTFKKWKEEGVSFPRPDTKMEWALTYPTASHRTLFVFGRERGETLIGKVHSTIWAGPAMRRLKPDAVEHSYKVSERIRKPIDSGSLPDSIRDKFGYFIEQGYMFMDRALYPEGVGALYRSTTAYPGVQDSEKRFLMPTFSAHNNAINVTDNTSENPLTQLIDWNTKDTGGEPVDYFIREILKPFYDIYFYYMFEQGFLLEPHGQNFFLEIDENGKLRRLVFKDWQSTMVDMKLRKDLGLSRGQSIVKHLLGIEASEETSLSIVFDYYWGTYLMKQLLEVMVNRYHGDKEKVFYRQLLLERFKDVFETDYSKYPAAQKEFSDVSIRHGNKPSGDRTNTVYFAAGGAPLLRKTNYEREVRRLVRDRSARKGKVKIPINKIVDENAIIQRQEDLPNEMVIDFDRVKVEDNAIVVYPKDYDPKKKYNLLVALHGKGSHPARLTDIPEKIADSEVIVVIPKAPFRFGTGYTWIKEGDEELKSKTESVNSIAEIIRNFEREGKITGNTYVLGISEGGYMAHLFGMRHPDMVKGVIMLNAPFRENYFIDSDMANVTPAGYPNIFILQYNKDRIVVPANSQRAEDFYKMKGLTPKVQYYSSGAHHRLSNEMGEDINRWMKISEGQKVGPARIGREEVLAVFKEAQSTAKMVEELIPLLLLLLPDGNTERDQVLRERFNLIASSLCYCLFQVELKVKDAGSKIDPDLLDTVKWMGKETKTLLEKLMELKDNVPNGDINLTINNVSENKDALMDMLGIGKAEVLVRIPVQVFSGIDKDSVAKFLRALQKASNCFIELYSVNGAIDVNADYMKLQNLPSEGFVRTRENTITLFVPGSEDLTPGNLEGGVGLALTQTVLYPIGLRNDPVGLIRGIVMGFRLLHIARNKADIGFVEETVGQYKVLFNSEGADLSSEDLLGIAVGNKKDIIEGLKKLIKLLPIERYDPEDIKKAYQHAENVLTAA